MKGFVLITLLLTTSAYGQTAPQVTDALVAIRTHDKALGVSLDNMLGMRAGQEADVLNSACNIINFMRVADGTVIAVANLALHMRDSEDLKHVIVQLQSSLDVALSAADIAVQAMNGYMALAKGPAAVTEMMKARDEMIAIREALRSLKGGGPPSAQ